MNKTQEKKIDEITEIIVGGDKPVNIQEERSQKFNIPVISNGIKENAILGYTDSAIINQPSITISSRGTIGFPELRNEPYYPVVRLLCLIPNSEIVPDFLKYQLETKRFVAPDSGIKQLTAPMLKKIKIKVPILTIQKEIVDILNTFQDLISTLKSELELREKQYKYISDSIWSSLLQSAELRKFSEIASFNRGLTYKKNQEELNPNENSIGVLRANNIDLDGTLNLEDIKWLKEDLQFKKDYILKNNDILICIGSGSKEHIGKVTYIKEDLPYLFGGFMATLRSNKLYMPYLYHFLKSSYFKRYLNQALASPTINNLNSSIMGKFEIPVISEEKQEDAIRLLEELEELKSLLVDEIDLRQKQYEYYRDKLLDFGEEE